MTHILTVNPGELNKKVAEELKVQVETGTVNMANPLVRSGIICNDYGLVVGDASGGPEVTHIDESLGFLEKEISGKIETAADEHPKKNDRHHNEKYDKYHDEHPHVKAQGFRPAHHFKRDAKKQNAY